MSSRDIKLVYDSPLKTDIKLALMRLGIPLYIAGYLMSIDSEGKTLIRTSAAYTAWTKKLRKLVLPTIIDEELPQPSNSERGASQGTVLSPTAWIAFFDILLMVQSSMKQQHILLPELPGKLAYTRPSIYG